MVANSDFTAMEMVHLCSQQDIYIDNEYRLKLSSKKLKSGKCQVKFYATVRKMEGLHGYVLVDANQTLKSVVSGINRRLKTIQQARDFQQIHLYSIGNKDHRDMNFIFFDK